jgi:methyl-accepting chemotaxis protein
MRWFRNLHTGRKLAVAFGMLEILMIGLGVFSLVQLSRVNGTTVQVIGDQLPSVRVLGNLKYDTAAMRRSELSYLLAFEHKEKWDSAMKQALDDLQQHEKQYEPLISSAEERNLDQEFREAWDKYLAVHAKVMKLTRDNEYQANVLAQSEGNSAFEVAAQSLQAEVDVNDKAAADFTEGAAQLYSSSRYWIIGFLGCAVAAGFAMATAIGRGVSTGVTRMLAQMQEIAANNLAVADVQVDSDDEIGQASLALNTMKNNLRDVIQMIAETAERVAGASEEISSAATEQSNSAEAQEEQTSRVATAMQEMSATVRQVSENSAAATEASRLAAETARKGGGIVEDVLTKMRGIAESVQGTARKMEELGRSSDQIGRIAGVIDEIADQTNLLALNAAIEAARAGDHGRGFAVVADEVRKLAEGTTSATKEIADMIANIQQGTRSAIVAMQSGSSQVEVGVQFTGRAGDSLKQIIQMSEQVGEMIVHMATAANEQSKASDEINQNMDQISRLVKESAHGAQQSAKACHNLSGLALDLQKMVGNFRLGGSDRRGERRGSGQQFNSEPWSEQSAAGNEQEPPGAFGASAG